MLLLLLLLLLDEAVAALIGVKDIAGEIPSDIPCLGVVPYGDDDDDDCRALLPLLKTVGEFCG